MEMLTIRVWSCVMCGSVMCDGVVVYGGQCGMLGFAAKPCIPHCTTARPPVVSCVMVW